MRMQSKSKTKLIAALAATMTLCVGFAVVNEGNQTVANADNATAITVVGAAVRYPAAEETVAEGTGLKFEVKVTGYETAFGENLANVENLGVLVNVDGVPDVENTPNGTVGANVAFIANGVPSEEYVYEVKDDGLYMYVELKHVPANYFHHNFVCRAYYDLKEADVVYSDTIQRSAIYVINEAIADESDKAPDAEHKAALAGLRAASTDHTAATYGEVVTPPTDNEMGTKKALCACGEETENLAPVGLYHYEFDANGGEAVAPISGVSYDKITELPTATRTDYDFLGWYDAEGNKVEAITVPYAENETGKIVTLTAKWAAKYIYQNDLANGYYFDGEDKVHVATYVSGIRPSYDATENAMKVYIGTQNVDMPIAFDNVELKAGDAVGIVLKNAGFAVRLKAGDTYIADVAAKDTVQEYKWSITADTTLSTLNFAGRNANKTAYIYSIRIYKAASGTVSYITEDELVNTYEFNSAEKIYGKVYGASSLVGYDASKSAMVVGQAGSGDAREVRFTDALSLNKGDKVFFLIDNGTVGGSFRIMNADGTAAKKVEISARAAGVSFAMFTWTADVAYTNVYISYINYSSAVPYYVKSIQIVKTSTAESKTLTVEQLEAGVSFNSADMVASYVTPDSTITAMYDGEQAMKLVNTAANKGVALNIPALELNVGDKIVVSAYGTINTCLRVNGTWVVNTYAESSTGFATYTWTVPETSTKLTITDGKLAVTSLEFYTYTKNAGEWNIKSIQIIRASAQA